MVVCYNNSLHTVCCKYVSSFIFMFMPLWTICSEGVVISGCACVVRCLYITSVSRDGDISVFSGQISMKLDTNIHHVSEHCWKCFQGQRSKVKVICVQMCESYNGGGIHFDGMMSARGSLVSYKITKQDNIWVDRHASNGYGITTARKVLSDWWCCLDINSRYHVVYTTNGCLLFRERRWLL